MNHCQPHCLQPATLTFVAHPQVLREAALKIFDGRLDSIGSGMVNVRQVISLYRHGFLEAAGAPLSVHQDLFSYAPQPYREMASLYGDTVTSPRQNLNSRGAGFSRPKPNLKPIAASGQPAHAARTSSSSPQKHHPHLFEEAPSRPLTQGAPSRPVTHQSRPATQGAFNMDRPSTQGTATRSHRKEATTDDFGDMMGDFGEMMLKNDSSSSEDDDVEEFPDDRGSSPGGRFAGWGTKDLIAREQRAQPPVAGAGRVGSMARPVSDRMRMSTSLPSLSRALPSSPVMVKSDALLRLMAARLNRVPRPLKELFDGLDGGDGKTSPLALAEGLTRLASDAFPPLPLPQDVLKRLCQKFDYRSEGVVTIRDFARALGSGRLPSPRSRRRLANSPPPSPLERLKLRRRKKAESTAVVADIDPATESKPPNNSQLQSILKVVSPNSPPEAVQEVGQAASGEATAAPSATRGWKKLQTQIQFVQAATSASTEPHRQARRERRAQEEEERKAAHFKKQIEAQRRAARAAALMISSLRARADKSSPPGQVTRLQFNEAMVELGMIDTVTDDTDTLFNSLDSDGSGILQIGELETAVAQLVDSTMVAELEDMLKNGASIENSILTLRNKLSDQAARVIDLFQKWDTNSDGRISKDEFFRAMPLLGLEDWLPIEISALFTAFDPGGDGEISFRELHKMLRRDTRTRKKKVEVVVEEIVPLVEVPELRKSIRDAVNAMNFIVNLEELAFKPERAASPVSGLVSAAGDDDEGPAID